MFEISPCSFPFFFFYLFNFFFIKLIQNLYSINPIYFIPSKQQNQKQNITSHWGKKNNFRRIWFIRRYNYFFHICRDQISGKSLVSLSILPCLSYLDFLQKKIAKRNFWKDSSGRLGRDARSLRTESECNFAINITHSRSACRNQQSVEFAILWIGNNQSVCCGMSQY